MSDDPGTAQRRQHLRPDGLVVALVGAIFSGVVLQQQGAAERLHWPPPAGPIWMGTTPGGRRLVRRVVRLGDVDGRPVDDDGGRRADPGGPLAGHVQADPLPVPGDLGDTLALQRAEVGRELPGLQALHLSRRIAGHESAPRVPLRCHPGRAATARREGRYHAGMPNHVVVSTLGWSKHSLEDAYAGIAALEFGQADLALHEGWAHIDPSALADGGEPAVRREAQRIQDLVTRLEMKRTAAGNVGLGTADPAEQAPPPGRRLRPGGGARGAGDHHRAAPRGTPRGGRGERACGPSSPSPARGA